MPANVPKPPNTICAAHQQCGYVLILFSVLTVVLLGAAGLVTDGSRIARINRELQNLADRAATSAVSQLRPYVAASPDDEPTRAARLAKSKTGWVNSREYVLLASKIDPPKAFDVDAVDALQRLDGFSFNQGPFYNDVSSPPGVASLQLQGQSGNVALKVERGIICGTPALGSGTTTTSNWYSLEGALTNGKQRYCVANAVMVTVTLKNFATPLSNIIGSLSISNITRQATARLSSANGDRSQLVNGQVIGCILPCSFYGTIDTSVSPPQFAPYSSCTVP